MCWAFAYPSTWNIASKYGHKPPSPEAPAPLTRRLATSNPPTYLKCIRYTRKSNAEGRRALPDGGDLHGGRELDLERRLDGLDYHYIPPALGLACVKGAGR